MMSGGVHDFETMRLLLGEIESVQALRARQRFQEMEGDDTSVALVRFRSGAVGTLVESFLMKSLVTAAGPEVHTLRVDGTLGHLVPCAPSGSACGRSSAPLRVFLLAWTTYHVPPILSDDEVAAHELPDLVLVFGEPVPPFL